MTKRAYRRTPGSPPRMRGKPYSAFFNVASPRITPAHAGKTIYSIVKLNTLRDHPRACGENHTTLRTAGCRTGSPPRMRGKPNVYTDVVAREGITPAHAGKTPSIRHLAGGGRDHPRACGENPLVAFTHAQRRRITPAHAGKTEIGHNFCDAKRDHPRACGENRMTKRAYRRTPGSPPRMRGKPERNFDIWQPLGSPPRMRGKRIPINSGSTSSRITPAHAGKT